MNAHLIRIVEGPLASNALAANDPVFEQPAARARSANLSLVRTPAPDYPACTDNNGDNAEPAGIADEDDYYLGGYAGI